MPERSNGPDSKSGEPAKTGSVGSNPTLSARLLGLAAGLVLAGLVLALASPGQAQPLRLGVGTTTSQLILGQLTAQLLRGHGLEVEVSAGLAPEALRYSLKEGQLDLYWEYTGLALVLYQRNPDRDLLRRPERGYQAVKAKDEEEGLVWGAASAVNDTYGLLMPRPLAERLKLKSISDLAVYLAPVADQISGQEAGKPPASSAFKLAASPEFIARPDGYKAFAALYGFKLDPDHLLSLAEADLFAALAAGTTSAAIAPCLDSRLIVLDLIVLEEDKPFFPAYLAACLWRDEAAKARPEAFGLVNKLAACLDNQALVRLSYAVEVNQENPAELAWAWLKEKNLVQAAKP